MWRLCLLLFVAKSLGLTLENDEYNQDTQINYGFEIDYTNNQFLLDGKPFQYISGSFHYFRTPKFYWRDRLRKMRAAGLNAVSTYVEWSLHQPAPNEWRWDGDADIVSFLTTAQEEGLYVLLRPGPYICAERDLGGLPSWLMTLDPEIKMRTYDERYLRYVEVFFNELFQRIKFLLRGNGGPILMVQVENEYGSFRACDVTYREHLRDILLRHVGSKALLYTTDGTDEKMLRCGIVSGAYATVDFGSSADVDKSFRAMRKYQPSGPLVNSEYYSGWLTHWKEPFQRVRTERFVKTLKDMLDRNASINIYMFYGGTNFGFTSGANDVGHYWPQITSYDYDAPLDEAGDPTDKYFAIRNTIAEYFPLPNISVPVVSPKGDYGAVKLTPVMFLLEENSKELLSVTTGSFDNPPTFEALAINHGLVLYETNVPQNISLDDPFLFEAKVADRGLVYVDGYLSGTLCRMLSIDSLNIQNPYAQKLAVLVENQGHLNFGDVIEDWKGLFYPTIDGVSLKNWNTTSYYLDEIKVPNDDDTIDDFTPGNLINGPVVLKGKFEITNDTLDTYLNTEGWGKGVVYVNGNNLGRYWPKVGPQVTLYVPSVFLNSGLNELVVLEFEYVPENMKIRFQSKANLG